MPSATRVARKPRSFFCKSNVSLQRKLRRLLKVEAIAAGSITRVGAPRRIHTAPDTSVAAGSLKVSGIEVPPKAARMRSMQSEATINREALDMVAAVTARKIQKVQGLDRKHMRW